MPNTKEATQVKTDARTQYTKKVIRKCFFTLLKEKPLNKITVKSICEQAQINRTTFYRYYSDSYDLMEKLETELLDSFQSYVRDISIQGPEQAIEAMMNAVKDNTELYTILISDNADRHYIDKMVSNSYQFFQRGFDRRYPQLTPKQRKWLYYYMAQGCISIVLDWVDGGTKEAPKDVARFVTRLDDLLLKNLLP